MLPKAADRVLTVSRSPSEADTDQLAHCMLSPPHRIAVTVEQENDKMQGVRGGSFEDLRRIDR